MRNKLREEEIVKLRADVKYALVGIMNEEGYPHVNLLTSLEAKNDHEMMFGRNYYGRTKLLMEEKKDCGFLIMSLEKELWTGKMRYTSTESSGDDKVYYNEKPKNRYNAYYPVNDVLHFDLLEVADGKVDMSAYAESAKKCAPLAADYVSGSGEDPLTGPALEMASSPTCAKFLAYEGADGFPRLIPLMQAVIAGEDRFIFSPQPNAEDVADIPTGAKVTVHCLQLNNLQGVQFRGIYQGIKDEIGVIDVKQAYNPMPPCPRIIYPRKPLEAVTEF